MTINLLGALATAFIICAVTGPSFISVLHKLNFGQSIRECGPKEHMKKSGTPTMGGIMMLLAILVQFYTGVVHCAAFNLRPCADWFY